MLLPEDAADAEGDADAEDAAVAAAAMARQSKGQGDDLQCCRANGSAYGARGKSLLRATSTSSARSAGEVAAADEALIEALVVLEVAARAAESALATLSSRRGPMARATRTVCSGHSSRNEDVSSSLSRTSGEEGVVVLQASLMAWR